MGKTCPSCGKTLSEKNYAFCPWCGNDLVTPAAKEERTFPCACCPSCRETRQRSSQPS